MVKAALIADAIGALAMAGTASADVVTDWNRTMIDALEVAKTPPPPAARVAAIVQSAVFDAVNGIARRYTPVHVPPPRPVAPRRSRPSGRRRIRRRLYCAVPTQQPMLDQHLADTLSQTPGSDRSTALGVQWGKSVADQILAWRATDGSTAVLPPYVPAGSWKYRRTPPLFGPPLFRQFATMTPFALTSPSQFLLPAAGADERSVRAGLQRGQGPRQRDQHGPTPEQTQTAIFWQSDTPAAIWNRVADDLAGQNDGSVLRNARILA